MRIDSHQHFWQYNSHDYVWMTDRMDILRRDFLPESIMPLLEKSGFDGTIVVQARQKVAETEWLLDLADRYSFIRGIVGWVEFESGRLDQQLERFSLNPKFKGVRELIHDMADVNYATSELHARGVSKLARYGLTYDLLLKPPHIRPAMTLVEWFPEQRFAIDHIAKPDIARGTQTAWRDDIRAIAKHDNVWCKLSGMVTETSWYEWLHSDFRPYLDTVLDAFGADRLMIGSDWPVCTLSGDYDDVMGVVIHYAESLSPTERDAILGDTCAKFYKVCESVD